jgi:hypothetical protein
LKERDGFVVGERIFQSFRISERSRDIKELIKLLSIEAAFRHFPKVSIAPMELFRMSTFYLPECRPNASKKKQQRKQYRGLTEKPCGVHQ